MSRSNDSDVFDLFSEICDATTSIVAATVDWGESGRRAGQYLVDLSVDDACVVPLLAAGFSVLSEESGVQHPGSGPSARGIVVVDPLDGSTNASLGLPWCATSLCLVRDGRADLAMVANLATGTRYSAQRGGGAWMDGERLTIERSGPLDDAIIAISGLPAEHYGWRQFRAMGASALDLCAVAAGSFDGFVDMSSDAHGVWDYAGGLLVVEEAGGVVTDAFDRPLLELDPDVRRTPVAASHPELHAELRRRRAAG
jgi:myo-inositol-1(or 4)-monophosphatase